MNDSSGSSRNPQGSEIQHGLKSVVPCDFSQSGSESFWNNFSDMDSVNYNVDLQSDQTIPDSFTEHLQLLLGVPWQPDHQEIQVPQLPPGVPWQPDHQVILQVPQLPPGVPWQPDHQEIQVPQLPPGVPWQPDHQEIQVPQLPPGVPWQPDHQEIQVPQLPPGVPWQPDHQEIPPGVPWQPDHQEILQVPKCLRSKRDRFTGNTNGDKRSQIGQDPHESVQIPSSGNLDQDAPKISVTQPNDSSDVVSIRVPEFVIQISGSLPHNCWKDEIIKEFSAIVKESLRNIDLRVPNKITTGSKRATKTNCLPHIEQRNSLKHKYVHGADEGEFSHSKVTDIDDDPSLEMMNRDSSHDVFENVKENASSSKCLKRRNTNTFTAAELELLVTAVERLGIGRWQEIKLQYFKKSDRAYSELKEKWRTLVKTASIPPEKRRGPKISNALLCRIRIIEMHKIKAHNTL